jgi:hypothetical protein
MFFLSDDERFIVKTMRKSEIRTLIAMLPQVRFVALVTRGKLLTISPPSSFKHWLNITCISPESSSVTLRYIHMGV